MLQKTKYLRISVTEQCNQSCFFCHYEGSRESGVQLSTDDIVFFCAIAQKLGFMKFKLTGGEPTLREDICDLIYRLSELRLADLSMITNGSTLESSALLLWKAGLRRLNITLNTLNEKRHMEINTNAYVPVENIVRGIDTALRVGYTNMKINFVYEGENSDSDLNDLLNFVSQRSLTLVLLPILPVKHGIVTPNLSFLYTKMKKYGISEERTETDMEGIKRIYFVTKNSAKVLLRQNELSSHRPYVFCAECSEIDRCKEGIFPLRLSVHGVLIPCLANNHNQIELKASIKHRDEAMIAASIRNVWAWQSD